MSEIPDRCENCGRDAGLYESDDGEWLCGLCIPTDERRRNLHADGGTSTGGSERTRDGLPVPGHWYLAFREMASLSFQNDVEDATIRVFWDLEDQEQNDEIVYEVSVTKRVSVLDETPDGEPENLKRVLEALMLEVEDDE